jgi:CPA2 family monovalent cation:H+ antiporter-2
LFSEFVIIIVAATFVVVLFSRFRIPALIGFLFTGIIIGPGGLSWVKSGHELELMSEIGIILLMFSIGLEFSIKRIKEMKFEVLVLGALQVFLTMLPIFFIASAIGLCWQKSIFVAMILSVSSTAIVIKLLQDKNQLRTPAGKIMLGILLFQDICVVPFIIFTPMLSNTGEFQFTPIINKFGTAILLIIGLSVVSKYLLPKIIDVVFKTKVSELFLTFSLSMCFGLAILSAYSGFSMAMGAFIAGMILAESAYHYQIDSDVKPLRYLFLSLFFISVGMLLNTDFLINNFTPVILVTISILTFKALIIFAICYFLKQPVNLALRSGISISQIGEFSFMLLSIAKPAGVLNENEYQLFLSATVISMLLTPFLFFVGEIAGRFKTRKLTHSVKTDLSRETVIIIGFGINGQNLAKIFKSLQINYKVMDLNASLVKKYQEQGENIFFGDSTRIDNLEHFGVKQARLLVIAITDNEATISTVRLARQLNAALHIIARTENISEIKRLQEAGADEVISQEFEASIEVTTSVLKFFGISEPLIKLKTDNIRKYNYGFFEKNDNGNRLKISDLASIKEFNHSYFVNPNSALAGKCIDDIYKSCHIFSHISIIGIIRNKEIISHPPGDTQIETLDTIIIFGRQDYLDKAINHFENIDYSNT